MLVQDGLNIIRTAKRMIDSKNHDEIIQEFLFQTKSVDTSRVNLKDVNAKVGLEEAKADGDQSLEHLRVLGKLILTNSEF